MLHFETVESGTLSILKRLMQIEVLQPFSLVGGTALALRYGHRSSIDLDLFCHQKFDHESIADALKEAFGKGYSSESKTARWGIFCYIENVKVDIVYYPHLPIGDIQETDTLRMYSAVSYTHLTLPTKRIV